MIFGELAVLPDQMWPGMYCIRMPDGRLSDIFNLTRARNAARASRAPLNAPLPLAA